MFLEPIHFFRPLCQSSDEYQANEIAREELDEREKIGSQVKHDPVIYQTQVGPIRQSSLIGAERYQDVQTMSSIKILDGDTIGTFRYRARVLYDGANFNGWQLQPSQPSVQGLLEAVIAFKLRHSVRVIGAGRTDTGVHARGQAIHFDSPVEISNLEKFQHKVNMVLPMDVRVCDMQETKELVYVEIAESLKRWHAIYSAKGKLYSYRLYLGPTPDPLQRLFRSSPPPPPPSPLHLPSLVRDFRPRSFQRRDRGLTLDSA
jgi:hypothetical protein